MKAVGRAAILAAVMLLNIGAAPNWISVVEKTEGGHRIGNPDAKVKLVAFESYTCHICAEFEEEAGPVLKLAYVQTGNVSYEVRHFVRDPIDMTAAMLSECVPTEDFFNAHRALFLSYKKWSPEVGKASKGQRDRWFANDGAAARRAVASDMGFYEIMQRQGVSRVQADKCLANTALAERLARQTKQSNEQFEISGTPTFMLNGLKLLATHSWQMLKPQLEARL